jgi:hypothetical protein
MSSIHLKWNKELRLSGAALGREGLSLAAIAAVKQFDGSYKGAMVLAGRLKAIAQAAGYDGYWSEKVDDGFQKQRQILFSMSKHRCSCGNPLVSAEAICELCDSRRALEEITREMHSEARNKLRGKPKKFSPLMTMDESVKIDPIKCEEQSKGGAA